MGHVGTTWICRAIGAVFVYAALFLYESEEGRIQNKLEQWLESIQRKRTAALSASVAFLNEISRLAGLVLDKLFGKRLFSLNSIGSSICYSVMSMAAVFVISILSRPYSEGIFHDSHLLHIMVISLYVATLSLFLGRVPTFTTRRVIVRLWFFTITVVMPAILFRLISYENFSFAIILQIYAVIAICCTCNVLFVAFTRWMLRKTAVIQTLHRILALLLIEALFVIAMLSSGVLSLWLNLFPGADGAIATFVLITLGNAIDILGSALMLLLLGVILLHRLFWPIVERPLYALGRFKVVQNKKFLWTLGVALLIGPVADISFAKWIIEIVSKSGN